MRYASLLGASMLAATSSAKLGGEGEPLGARDPQQCPSDTSYPQSGPLDADQASIYLRCEDEYYNTHDGALYLAEFSPIGMGEPRGFNYDTDPSAADSDQPVQDISMTYYVAYICSPKDASNVGANCVTLERDAATGECYKTRQGNWRCTVNYDLRQVQTRNVVPPQ